MNPRRILRLLAFSVLASSTSIATLRASGQERPAIKAEKNDLPTATLEKQFRESMSGATLVGSYTIDGKADERSVQKERYTLSSVSKLPSGLWLFTARIEYGEKDVTLPIPLRVEWAGDTPVITLTDQKIPGLGTFTARVMIYRGRYAGTWQHDDVGGCLFGVVEKPTNRPRKDVRR